MVRRTTVATLIEQFWHRLPGGTAVATEKTLAALAEGGEFDMVGLAAHHRRSVRADSARTDRLPPGMRAVFHQLPRPALYEQWLRLDRPLVDGRIGGPDGRPGVFWASSLIVPPTRWPVVATVHDLDFLDRPQDLSRRGRHFFPRMWAAARHRSHRFICPSTVVAEAVIANGLSSDVVSVVPWGVDPPLCDEVEAAALRAALGLPERFVLWVGPVTPRKNPEGAAAAMAAVDADLVVVGGPLHDGPVADPFERLGSRVHRLPSVGRRHLSALYREARALLYPSHREGFGLPVLEAMAHATPVVTSRGTATEEVAAGAALLADPDDHRALGRALGEALADGAVRSRLIEQGPARAAQLSWTATAKGYGEIFHDLARTEGR